jgi:hypothetical protein
MSQAITYVRMSTGQKVEITNRRTSTETAAADLDQWMLLVPESGCLSVADFPWVCRREK